MPQENYKIEIVKSLLEKENHIKGLAKELDVDQTIIEKEIDELIEENVVGYKQKRRNRVYFLKKTPEALDLILIADRYELLEILSESIDA